MKEKLFDSEAKVMEIIWREGSLPAKEISLIAAVIYALITNAA